MPSSAAEAWIESLSPWPAEFGLGGIRALLRALGDPQLRYPAIHVVGTNGKTTTARMIEALLADDGLLVGTYTSPHVTGWAERIRVGGEEADFQRAVAWIRPAAEAAGATQFEALTAAALAEFAATGVQAAVVEAGLGGRLDATNVLRSRVVVLTNVGLDHTEHLGSTREAIAAEKLAVVRDGCTVVIGEPEWEGLARENGAGHVVLEEGNLGAAAAAAEAFLGRPVDPSAAAGATLPGRLEVRGTEPLELWDGAHNPEGVRYLLAHLPSGPFVLVLSILADKDVEGMLRLFAQAGDSLVATSSRNPRALPAAELARRARPLFSRVEAVDDPGEALARGREAAGERGAVLVSGSLYLLSALAAVRSRPLPWDASASG